MARNAGCCAKSRQTDDKLKRYHESLTVTPCALLLERQDLSAEHRHKLQTLLERHDPIELKASIETKLKGVYAQRARLLAEDQEEAAEARAPMPSEPKEKPWAGGEDARTKACVRGELTK